MNASSKQRAWITGAGKGIGRGLAIALADKGWEVAVSSRTESDLLSLVAEAGSRSGRIVAYRLDVTDEAAVGTTISKIEADLGELDLAVLNAGTHQPLKARDFDTGKFRALVETNLMGTVNCLGAVVPRFLARGRGHIAVVGSVAGYCGLPTAAAYGATKAALMNMCEALRPELEAGGVKLQLVSPGFVDTPLTRQNDFPMPFLISTDKAVDAILGGFESARFEIVFPRRMAVAMKVLGALPVPPLLHDHEADGRIGARRVDRLSRRRRMIAWRCMVIGKDQRRAMAAALRAIGTTL